MKTISRQTLSFPTLWFCYDEFEHFRLARSFFRTLVFNQIQLDLFTYLGANSFWSFMCNCDPRVAQTSSHKDWIPTGSNLLETYGAGMGQKRRCSKLASMVAKRSISWSDLEGSPRRLAISQKVAALN